MTERPAIGKYTRCASELTARLSSRQWRVPPARGRIDRLAREWMDPWNGASPVDRSRPRRPPSSRRSRVQAPRPRRLTDAQSDQPRYRTGLAGTPHRTKLQARVHARPHLSDTSFAQSKYSWRRSSDQRSGRVGHSRRSRILSASLTRWRAG